MGPPIIVQGGIDWLVRVEKPVPDGSWRSKLLPPTSSDLDRRSRIDLGELPEGGPLGGTLHLYARENLNPAVTGDWSVGLIYTDYADNTYPVIRCNGPHPTDHVNRIERTVISRRPHVHLLTERYQRIHRPNPSGYAEATDAFSTIADAVEYLASLANLQPAGRLFL
jgi:hypothetical protein